jgi:hypothetical protein
MARVAQDMSDNAAVRPIGKPLVLIFRGFLVNISNPKALVFMLAVLPQFIDPHAPLLAQYLIIGVTMICVDLIVMAGYTGLASRVLRLLRTPKQQKRMNRTFAGLFIGAAAFMATLRKAAFKPALTKRRPLGRLFYCRKGGISASDGLGAPREVAGGRYGRWPVFRSDASRADKA